MYIPSDSVMTTRSKTANILIVENQMNQNLAWAAKKLTELRADFKKCEYFRMQIRVRFDNDIKTVD